MHLTLANGNLLIGKIVLYHDKPWEELNLEIEQSGYKYNLANENIPYKGYNILGVPDGDYIFNVQVYFNSGKLISISISIDTDDVSLEEFISRSLEKVKLETLEITNRLIGGERYKGPWGLIEYSFDPRSTSVSIVINYD